jgi:DNA-binding response OmpR family regulator
MDLLSIPGDRLPVDYSEKKILIIDDYPNMQQSMRSVLNSFGISKIVASSSAKDAISKVKTQVFDGILCDYNLGGEEKDGQQTLEEMRSCSYIPLSTVFIMVTAETSYEKVIAAAEYVPDDYIIKPFNLNILRNRLTTGFAKKAMFAWVYEQTAKGHYLNAATKCDEIAKKFPKYRIDALRHKGELLLAMNSAKEAEMLYLEIAKAHTVPWAKL